MNQGDTGRTARVILDPINNTSHTIRRAEEVNKPGHSFVTAAAMPRSDFTLIVPATIFLVSNKQGLLR